MNKPAIIILTATIWGLILSLVFTINLAAVIPFLLLFNGLVIIVAAWKRNRELALSQEDLSLNKSFMSQMIFQGKDVSYFMPNTIGIIAITIILESIAFSHVLSATGLQTGIYSVVFSGFSISIGAVLLFFSNFLEGKFRIRTHKGLPHKYLFLEGTPARLVNLGFIIIILLFIYFGILPLL